MLSRYVNSDTSNFGNTYLFSATDTGFPNGDTGFANSDTGFRANDTGYWALFTSVLKIVH